MKKFYAVEVVRRQTGKSTRSEIYETVSTAIEQLTLKSLPIVGNEGFELPLEDLEQLSSGISDLVEVVTVYLESRRQQKRKAKVAGITEDTDLPHEVELNGGGLLNGTDTIKEEFSIYLYDLDSAGEQAEYMEDNDEEEGQSAASHHWILPSKSFHGLWDSLIFEADIKCKVGGPPKLFDYVQTAVRFSNKGVNPALVSWNKVVLLHGPPGTGKTSLCKALAQKAAIRLQGEFLYGQLIEINSHSLFSKWFSESGKLVTKMFDKILELVEDPKGLVFLLIDEVESLAQCRQSAEMGNEPTDSIRAVNALLTQIDRIKRYPNVLVLTTSNIVGSIDLALVDRADLKIYVGQPPTTVIYGILASCVNELIRVNLVTCENGSILPTAMAEGNGSKSGETLQNISKKARGLSGRCLRKLPFLAYANCFSESERENCVNITEFLEGLSLTVDKELSDRKALGNRTPPCSSNSIDSRDT